MRSASVLVPEALHICPRCGDLASGTPLCEDCTALAEIGRNLDGALRRELESHRHGRSRTSRLREKFEIAWRLALVLVCYAGAMITFFLVWLRWVGCLR